MANVTTIVAVPGDAAPPAPDLVAAKRPDFQIVPLVGLPIVAAILAGLVAAIATNKLWALDFFHVVGGGLWTGIDLFLGFVIGPILGRLSVPARIEFSSRFMPKMLLIMPTLVTMTLAAGWQLARHLGNLSTAYPHHGWLVASFVVVGVMAVVALGLLEPANLAVLFELKKPRPNGEFDLEADEAVRVHRRCNGSHADSNARDHDEAGRRMSPVHDEGHDPQQTAKLPPVAELCVGSMALIIAGGIYLASYLPRRASLGPAIGLLVAAVVLLAVSGTMLARTRAFAWSTFLLVGKWTLLAYLVITGMLEYVFVLDHTRGSMLVLVTLMLLVFALDIPTLLGFSVARYQSGERGSEALRA